METPLAKLLGNGFLHQTVELSEIGHHARDWIDSSLQRDKAVPFPALMASLHGAEGIAPRHTGDVDPRTRGHLGVEILVFMQGDGMKDPDVFLPDQLRPEHTSEVF